MEVFKDTQLCKFCRQQNILKITVYVCVGETGTTVPTDNQMDIQTIIQEIVSVYNNSNCMHISSHLQIIS